MMSKQPLTDEKGEVREATAADLADMYPANKRGTEIVSAYTRSRGRPRKGNRKISTTIRLDPEILAYFKSSKKGWQTRINNALADYVVNHPQE